MKPKQAGLPIPETAEEEEEIRIQLVLFTVQKM